jgi:hypothetical protein
MKVYNSKIRNGAVHCMEVHKKHLTLQALHHMCKDSDAHYNHSPSSETCQTLPECRRRTRSSSAIGKRSIEHKLLLSIDLSNTSNGIVVRDARYITNSDRSAIASQALYGITGRRASSEE